VYKRQPWDNFETSFAPGVNTTGKIVRIIEKGVIAELPAGVDGFVPASQLSTGKLKNIAFCFPVEAEIPLKVVEFDKENKKIVLSALMALKEKDNAEIEQYITKHKLEKVTVEDIKNATLSEADTSGFPSFDGPEEKAQPAAAPAAGSENA
jgi:small subunit ribosomal protein S1